MHRLVLVAVGGLVLFGCSSEAQPESPSSTSAAPIPASAEASTVKSEADAAGLDDVSDELVEMARVDQQERSHFGDPDAEPWNDEERTARLVEIVDEYGWPTPDLVGDEASSAAWLIVQHSDEDPGFQQRVLSLLMEQVPDFPRKGQQVALLTDRVAANTGKPQVYGSQVGCFEDQPVPRPKLAEPERVGALREQVGLEPLEIYLRRFDQHCSDQAQIPIDAGCPSVPGATHLLWPGGVILVGELHGTNESPAFVDALTCVVLSFDFEVNIGLEIPDEETQTIEAFLASDGGPDARRDLLSGSFWSSGVADGRQSTAILELLDSLRRRIATGAPIDVVLLDSADAEDRDVAMADKLLAAVARSPERVTVALTGNIHSRGERGASFDPDYEPMGYLVKQALDVRSVFALDVRHSGGKAWTCTPEASCGAHTFLSATPADVDRGEALAVVDLFAYPNSDGFDGTYFVGNITPAEPAA
ncbi:MAG: ChaN family lipoprotein [bacterium]|nr:ChaN family lipoprotein [bacterium]